MTSQVVELIGDVIVVDVVVVGITSSANKDKDTEPANIKHPEGRTVSSDWFVNSVIMVVKLTATT